MTERISVSGPLSCVLVGEESLLIRCAESLLERGHAIRGIASTDAAITSWAAAHAVPMFAPGATLAASLRAASFDYLFSVTNLRVLGADVLATPRLGAINFHDGPLPRYAGLNAPAWAIINGEREHGVTWHWIGGEIDSGDILAQELIEIAADDTALTLNLRCYDVAAQSFGTLIDDLAAGTVTPRAQDMTQRSYLPRHKRPRAAGVLDLCGSAEDAERLVRGLDFGGYANPLALAKLLTPRGPLAVHSAVVTGTRSTATPGTVTRLGADRLVVATATADLLLTRLARLDRTPLSSRDLVAEFGLHVGQQLPTLTDAQAHALTARAEVAAPHERFWTNRLARVSPPEVPGATRAGGRVEAAAQRLAGSFAPDVRATLDNDPHRADALVAASALFLARISDAALLDLGYSDPSLQHADPTVAMLFSERVPLRTTVQSERPFSENLAFVRAAIANGRTRSGYPRDLAGRSPRLASLRGQPEGAWLPVGVAVVDDVDAAALTAGFELTLALEADGLRYVWLHDANVYCPEVIAGLNARLHAFLANAAAAPETPLAQVSLLSAHERWQTLYQWNATETPYPDQMCIHQAFEACVAANPDATALICGEARLTYAELNAHANRLARHLRGLGVGPDVLVGICADRSLEMVMAILAVHKAGGGYVPLDPEYPPDRIQYMLEDAAAPVLLTRQHLIPSLPTTEATLVCLDVRSDAIDAQPDANLDLEIPSDSLAYVIYTSGSTGKPKGVMVEHRNVLNFFTGMDARIGTDPGVWLAVTSLSFDISVLELLWTLTRGFTVVLAAGDVWTRMGAVKSVPHTQPLSFSLMFFASDGDAARSDTYQLLLDGARFADGHGFEAVWTPERHFHQFGGPFPNPSVTSAAIAAITEHVQIRAGSCVLPLHSPIRVAEEWAVVDVISGGRVGISFAAGWQPDDFVLKPENHADAKAVMQREIETVRRLWRGEPVSFPGPGGREVAVRTLPRPLQAELPVWITSAGSPETFRMAGAMGANILTHLLGQKIETVATNIAAYRQAWDAAGHPAGAGRVTLMLHTFVGDDDAAVRELVREPMKAYLRSSVGLIKEFAWSFPAFQQRPDLANAGGDLLSSLTPEEMDALLDHAFERYYETSGLFGTPARCLEIVESLRGIGVDEVACLIDFGVAPETVMQGLHALSAVKDAASVQADPTDQSLAGQIARHGVTHLQCTPSMARMLLADDRTRDALRSLRCMMVGGEALPGALAHKLRSHVSGDLLNMYGPTETTIWSSTARVTDTSAATVSIGTPIANTRLYILDEHGEPLPVGMTGELYIGGAGVVRGYLHRPDLTAERFLPDPFAFEPGARIYRTGDLARFAQDGSVEFLGRIDHQVKIRGYRIELGEIEAALVAQPGVREAVVIAREDAPGDTRLVAYLVPEPGATPELADLRAALSTTLPEFMLPSAIVLVDRFPLTPNKKIDRTALPSPSLAAAPVATVAPTPMPNIAEQAATAAVAEGALTPTVSIAPPVSVVAANLVAAPAEGFEATVSVMWCTALNRPSVGLDDNFFDLGGHSLLIVHVQRQLTETLGMKLSLTDLFRFPTVRTLAAFLAERAADGDAPAAIVGASGGGRADLRRDALARRRALVTGRV